MFVLIVREVSRNHAKRTINPKMGNFMLVVQISDLAETKTNKYCQNPIRWLPQNQRSHSFVTEKFTLGGTRVSPDNLNMTGIYLCQSST